MFIEEQSRLEPYIVVNNDESKKEFVVGVERTCLVTTSCFVNVSAVYWQATSCLI